MKSFSRLLLVLLVSTLTRSAHANEKLETVLASIKSDCLAGRLEVWADVAYEPPLARLGGREKVRATFKNAAHIYQEKKIKLVRFDFVPPYQFVKGKDRSYAVVPTISDILTDKGTMHEESFQLAIESSPGVWQLLVDPTRAVPSLPAIRKLFPDFPDTVKLPERKNSLIPPTS